MAINYVDATLRNTTVGKYRIEQVRNVTFNRNEWYIYPLESREPICYTTSRAKALAAIAKWAKDDEQKRDIFR